MKCLGKQWNQFFFLTLIIASMSFLGGCTEGPREGSSLDSSNGKSSVAGERKDNEKLPEGSAVEDCQLGGLKENSARKKIGEWSSKKLEQKIKLVYNGMDESVSLKDLGMTVDEEKTWQTVNNNPGRKVNAEVKFEEKSAQLQALYEKFTQKPVNATFTIENDTFKVTPAQEGWTVNYSGTVDQLKNIALNDLPEEVDVVVTSVAPQVSTESIQQLAFDSLICEFETKYNVNEKNRSSNLEKAAKIFDNKLLRPNETISFNDLVGPRTPERGYKDAYVIINNEYVEGTGGGICQVTSTLYNIALLANLEIVERHPHAVAINYVPLGQDATVNYPNLDLKLKNPFPNYIFLRVEAGGGVLRIKVYGKKTDQTVQITHVVEKVVNFNTERHYDANLAPGKRVVEQKGTKGYTVSTYKIIKNSKGEENQQLLSKDVYKPSNKIERIGPRRNFQE